MWVALLAARVEAGIAEEASDGLGSDPAVLALRFDGCVAILGPID